MREKEIKSDRKIREVTMLFPKPTHKRKPKPKVIKVKMQDKKECWVCKTISGLEKNHIFGGANRELSELYGLYVYMCHNHHNENIPGDAGFHHNKKLRKELQSIAQQKFEDIYGHDEFLRIFKGVIYFENTMHDIRI